VAVVVSPANKSESVEGKYGLTIRGYGIPINRLWGKRNELDHLMLAMDALEVA
jgi:hypothetical protein